MTRTNSFRAVTLATMLALGAPVAAFAAPANTGGAAEASEFQIARSVETTLGSVNVAQNTGNAAQANGNAPGIQAPTAQYMVGDNVLANVGNGPFS